MQQVREVMSQDVKIASPKDSIEKAAKLMAEINCGALPVGENGRLVGVVTEQAKSRRPILHLSS